MYIVLIYCIPYKVLRLYIYSNEAELDLDAERPAKRARGDEDSTDFTMASLAKGDITQVLSYHRVIVSLYVYTVGRYHGPCW